MVVRFCPRVIKSKNMKAEILKRKTIKIKAIELAKNFDLKVLYTKVAKNFLLISYTPNYIFLNIYPKRKQYLLIFRYGIAVLINTSEIFEKRILIFLQPFISEPISPQNFEEIKVVINPEVFENKVLFNKVILNQEDEKYYLILGMLLAQALALEAYEKRADELLTEFSSRFQRLVPIINRLLFPGTSSIIRNIQEVTTLHQEIIAKLEVLDKPELTWERKEYDSLYFDFSEELDLGERISVLEQKLSLLKSHMEMALDIISTRRMEILEIVIIILIFLSILQGILGYYK